MPEFSQKTLHPIINVSCSSIITLDLAALVLCSVLLRQPSGVQVGHGPCLDLKCLSLDVMAGDLLAGLADGDGLAALAADMNGLAVLLPAHFPLRGLLSGSQLLGLLVHHLQRLDGPLCYRKGLRGTVMGLKVLHRLFTQSDNMHLLRLALQYTDLRVLVRPTALSDQSHVLHVS